MRSLPVVFREGKFNPQSRTCAPVERESPFLGKQARPGLRRRRAMRVRIWLLLLSALAPLAAAPPEPSTPINEGRPLRNALVKEAAQPGKPSWQPMLLYLAELHGRSVHPPTAHFRYPWEDIGPGYQGGMTFGQIDLTHERLDT